MSDYDDEYEYSADEYSMDDDDDNDDNAGMMDWNSSDDGGNPNAAPTATMRYKVPVAAAALKSGIRMMRAEDLRPMMERRIKDVEEVLGVPKPAAAVLLRQYGWSKEALMEEYTNGSGDTDDILKRTGVYHRCGNVVPLTKAALKTCEICMDDDCAKEDMLGMPCGCAFCKDCWYDFSVNAIDEGPSCVATTCPQATCNEIVTEEEFAVALKVPQGDAEGTIKLAKYKNFQLRSFVESNAMTRWCPGRGCERVACAESASAMEAENNIAHCDDCYTDFCLVCGEEPHAPSTCKDLARWNEKCRNESETANWILANTKSCPKCHSRIEKNQGCNHMTCQKCRHEFCWICMGDWKDHGSTTGGYYKCNKFADGSKSGDDDQSDAARAKRELDRYLHYYKRFHAHEESQKYAKKSLKDTEAKMVQLQEHSDAAKWSDVEFLKHANEQLVECRRVLKYTYVFAFYMTDPSLNRSKDGKKGSSIAPSNPNASLTLKMQRERFEYHQEMLERFTESLQEQTEKSIDQMDRTDVVNQTRVVDRFMKNILKYVDDGMEEA